MRGRSRSKRFLNDRYNRVDIIENIVVCEVNHLKTKPNQVLIVIAVISFLLNMNPAVNFND